MGTKERIVWIDNARAIGIALVVAGHLDFPSGLINYIYSFHMPLFFLLSGVTFNAGDNFLLFLKKKSKSILIPYFLFSFVTYLFWLLIGRKFGQDSNRNIQLYKPLIGIFYSNGIDNWLIHDAPLWFLTCLFIIDITFFFLAKIESRFLGLLLFILSIGGYLLSLTLFPRLPWGINVALTGIVFFGWGYILKTNSLSGLLVKRITLFMLMIVFFILNIVVSEANGRIDMNTNFYGNYFLFYSGAGLGILTYIILSILIPKNRICTYLAANTLIILSLHSLIFSFIKGVQFFVFRIPLEKNSIMQNMIYTVLCLLLSVPIIMIINKYAPWMAGQRSLKVTKV